MVWVSWTSKFGTTTNTTDVTITGTDEVEITGNVTVRDINVTAGGKLRLAPGANITVSCWGNLYVADTGSLLQVRPTLGFKHTITFMNVNEAAFVGTSSPTDHSFQPTDKGLWIFHKGRIDAGDARNRTPWVNLEGSANAGATTIVLKTAPQNWQVGDRLVITPTIPANNSNHYNAYDDRTITAISADQKTITLSSALTHNHPATTIDASVVDGTWTQPTSWTAEVLNVTRDVLIQGQPTGKAHVMIHSTAVQYVKNLAIRYMGPQHFISSTQKVVVLGRYSFHMHHGLYCDGYETGARHTTDNIVVTEGGSRSFVIHNTHGVTLNDCISHDTQAEAFWWDVNSGAGTVVTGNETHDLMWNHCVGSKASSTQGFNNTRMSIFSLADGTNITVQDCVAVGEQSAVGGSSAGFQWPEGALATWTFRRNLSHNCLTNGLFVWQNTSNEHLIEDYVCYNAKTGIDHGAYKTSYSYERALLIACTEEAVKLHSSSQSNRRQRMVDFGIDGKGISKRVLRYLHPNLPPSLETDLSNWRIINQVSTAGPGSSGYAVVANDGVGSNLNQVYCRDWRFLDNTVVYNRLVYWDSNFINEEDVLKFRRIYFDGASTGFFNVRHPAAATGTANTNWNGAKVETLAADDYDAPPEETTELFKDTFSTDIASGWGSNWKVISSSGSPEISVTNGRGRIRIPDAGGAHVHMELTNPPLPSTGDAQISGIVDLTELGTVGKENVRIWLRASGTPTSRTGYLWQVYAPTTGSDTQLIRVVNGVSTTLANVPAHAALETGIKLKFKLRIREGRLKIRVWNADAGEPSLWSYDTAITDAASLGGQPLIEQSRGNGAHVIRYDDLRVGDFSAPPPPPTLVLTANPTSLSFSPTSLSQTVTINQSDTGGAPAQVSVTAKPDWITVTPSTFSVPRTLTVTVDQSLISTTTSSKIFFFSNTHGELQLPVSYTAGTSPTLAFSESSPFILTKENPRSVTVTTSGAATTVSLTGAPSYISITPSSATTPATFTLKANTTGLTDDSYPFSVTASSTGYASARLDAMLEIFEEGLYVWDVASSKWILTGLSEDYVVSTNDSRLTDSRPPLPHAHAELDAHIAAANPHSQYLLASQYTPGTGGGGTTANVLYTEPIYLDGGNASGIKSILDGGPASQPNTGIILVGGTSDRTSIDTYDGGNA